MFVSVMLTHCMHSQGLPGPKGNPGLPGRKGRTVSNRLGPSPSYVYTYVCTYVHMYICICTHIPYGGYFSRSEISWMLKFWIIHGKKSGLYQEVIRTCSNTNFHK